MKQTFTEKKDIFNIVSFILFNASLFHEILAGVNRQIESLSSISPPLKDNLCSIWENKIIPIDYNPIFDIGIRILKNIPSNPKIEHMLQILINTAIRTACSGAYLNHDLLGRLYHKLLLKTTGKYYATYYTSIPAATLLSNLLIKCPNPDESWDFGNSSFLKSFRIIDPACGSGTLLSSIYSTVRNEYLLNSAEKLLHRFHKIMLENVIYGFDILDYATHLSLTSLSLHYPKAFFNSTNIYTLRIGKILKNVYLGSLDFLPTRKQLPLTGKGFTLHHRRVMPHGIENIYNEIDIKENSFDVVIMNPPFSRSALPNIKFGFVSKEVKKFLDKELKRRAKDSVIKLSNGRTIDLTGIGQAGLGAYFIFVADRLLKDGGRLGLVIPRAILSGVSWEKVRMLFFYNYHIEFIISNHDPGDNKLNIEAWNWSEQTDLSEILLIARKTNITQNNKKVIYINIWNKPSNSIESTLLSQQILNYLALDVPHLTTNIYYLKLNSKDIGSIYAIDQNDIKYNWLYPCLFANPNLNSFVYTLKNGLYKKFKSLYEFKEIKHFGVDCGSISKKYQISDTPTMEKAIWGYPIDLNKYYLSSEYLKYVRPINNNTHNISKKGNVLIPYTMYLQNHKIFAFYSDNEIISNAFWAIKFSNQELAKLVVLWLNSTFGLIEMLSQGISSRGFHFEFKQANIKNIKVPYIDEFDTKKLNIFFNTFKYSSFSNIAEEFEKASIAIGIRKLIDDFFIDTLKIRIDLKHYYEILAKEPMFTLKRL